MVEYYALKMYLVKQLMIKPIPARRHMILFSLISLSNLSAKIT